MNSVYQSRSEQTPKKKNIGVKVLSVLLVISLFCVLAVPAFASSTDTDTTKQEVVYINLHSDGSVSEICVVNIFDLNEDGQIVDYGDYTALRNMTGNEEIVFENETVKIDAKAGKLYYEGKLSRNTIPWIFSFRYWMDDTEYQAKDIAGKDGSLKIAISIRQNPDCDSRFFENYGLQVSLTLDTSLCRNIVSDGATTANVGKNRQLTYTILPGMEKEMEITADVTDFEMPSIAINGLPLNMEIDLDKVGTAELEAELNRLKDAVAELNDGVAELKDGTVDLSDGASDLSEGASELNGAIGEAVSGATELDSGLGTLSQNSNDLRNGAYAVFTQLTSAAEAQLNQSLTAAGYDTVTLTPEMYSAVIATLLERIADDAYSQAETVARDEIRTRVYAAVAAQIEDAITYDSDLMAEIDAGVEEAYGSEMDGLAQNYVARELAKVYAPDDPEAWLQTTDGQSAVASYLASAEGQTAVAEARAQIKIQYVDAAVSAQVTAQMETEAVQTQIEAVTAEQLATDEVQQQIEESVESALNASEAYQGIIALEDQLDSYNAFYLGLLQYTAGVDSAASGAEELNSGLVAIENGSQELKNGIAALTDGVKDLSDGIVLLHEKTTEFREETENIDTVLKDKINQAIKDVLGSDFEVISFVSAQNKNVESVQFVIQTEAITIPETAAPAPAVEEKLNFWQKLLRLFGLY